MPPRAPTTAADARLRQLLGPGVLAAARQNRRYALVSELGAGGAPAPVVRTASAPHTSRENSHFEKRAKQATRKRRRNEFSLDCGWNEAINF